MAGECRGGPEPGVRGLPGTVWPTTVCPTPEGRLVGHEQPSGERAPGVRGVEWLVKRRQTRSPGWGESGLVGVSGGAEETH
ncbi:hypothetical protein NDU88_005442 [Pleurodeles waltl]|uniref:Uncharacterized protein n=1 Tax=Pleurodeles waltl TaxID=8319 RepID=A0AAV7QFZ2_PLEWA|nr:hypothetical protein NDU88_005442 [Pleurodeles waltl]